MTALPNRQEDGDDVSPLNLIELKLRLLHGDPGHYAARAEAIREIVALGVAASSLLPVVVEQYRADKLKGVAVSSLVELYLQSHHQELLDALREKGAFRSLSVFEQCALLEAGVSELETTLSECLWQRWATAGNPGRVEIVKSFGQVGGPKSLEMLGVIRYKMAAQVQEAKANSCDSFGQEASAPDALLRGQETDENEAFLRELRTAIIRMRERGIG